jgi:hypothetical protein
MPFFIAIGKCAKKHVEKTRKKLKIIVDNFEM